MQLHPLGDWQGKWWNVILARIVLCFSTLFYFILLYSFSCSHYLITNWLLIESLTHHPPPPPSLSLSVPFIFFSFCLLNQPFPLSSESLFTIPVRALVLTCTIRATSAVHFFNKSVSSVELLPWQAFIMKTGIVGVSELELELSGKRLEIREVSKKIIKLWKKARKAQSRCNRRSGS